MYLLVVDKDIPIQVGIQHVDEGTGGIISLGRCGTHEVVAPGRNHGILREEQLGIATAVLAVVQRRTGKPDVPVGTVVQLDKAVRSGGIGIFLACSINRHDHDTPELFRIARMQDGVRFGQA